MPQINTLNQYKRKVLQLSFAIIFLWQCNGNIRGDWSNAGLGLSGPVQKFEVFDSSLYAAVYNYRTQGLIRYLVRWDGKRWRKIKNIPSILSNKKITAIKAIKNELYLAGEADSTLGTCKSIVCKWYKDKWTVVDTSFNKAIHSFIAYKDMLYVAGDFDSIDGEPFGHIAKWDGTKWNNVGNGTGYDIYALAEYKGQLYAGGADILDTAHEISNKIIAKWDGKKWTYMGKEWRYGDVFSLVVYADQLYAGGSFDLIGNLHANNVARWDGSTWYSVGLGFNGAINAIAVYENELYCGGVFNYSGNTILNNLAFWDGKQWCATGGVNGDVYSLAVYKGMLYVGGKFDTVNNNIPANNVAKWSRHKLIE